MGEQPDTTTVEVKFPTYTALDKRKDHGESFDDVIRRLIDSTPVGFGELKDLPPDMNMEHRDVELISDVDEIDAKCSHYDVISGESCDNSIKYREGHRFNESENWQYFYYCKTHVPSD